MKAPILLLSAFAMWLALVLPAAAQPPGCTFKAPTVTINFGSGPDVEEFNAASLPNYDRISGSCPTDGHYTYTPATYDCFRGDWFTIPRDHTPGDEEGNMLLVNASPAGGVFFSRPIKGLQGGRTYECALWIINVCRLHICCSSLSPNISFMITTTGGTKLASYRIGDLPQRTSPQWRKFAGYFTLPKGENSVVLTLFNSTIGGCGNDFALDDITFRECVPAKTQVKEAPKKSAPTKPVATAPPKKEQPSKIEKEEAVLVQTLPVPEPKKVTAIPQVLRNRANPLVRQIETGAGEIVIDVYDNGQIDGDTVSVYHNNALVIAQARLSQTHIRLRVQVDKANPHHEIIMVAHNLGSIPPNTSLMIVTAGDKRYQVHISSSEVQNAKVVFQLKE